MHAVIMAGGKGIRLRPYTTRLPKPLMPVGGAPPASAFIREHGLEAVGRLILKLPRYFLPDLASVNAGHSGTSKSGRSSAKKKRGAST